MKDLYSTDNTDFAELRSLIDEYEYLIDVVLYDKYPKEIPDDKTSKDLFRIFAQIRLDYQYELLKDIFRNFLNYYNGFDKTYGFYVKITMELFELTDGIIIYRTLFDEKDISDCYREGADDLYYYIPDFIGPDKREEMIDNLEYRIKPDFINMESFMKDEDDPQFISNILSSLMIERGREYCIL